MCRVMVTLSTRNTQHFDICQRGISSVHKQNLHISDLLGNLVRRKDTVILFHRVSGVQYE